jgi:hypothetical protein
LTALQVEVNEEKSRIVDLGRSASSDSTSAASAVDGAYGVRSTRRSSRSERHCCRNSRRNSAAIDPNQ